MAIRPIIFSTPMVQALLAGRKTQTRRLSTSPLRRVEVGDLLYVRESFSHGQVPELEPEPVTSYFATATPLQCELVKWKPSIHMPRRLSRLTLEVTRVRYDRLQAISSADSIAEGIEPSANSQTIDCETANPRDAFHALWDSLHDKPGERWADDPMIVALTFTVHRANVDHLPAGE